MFVEFFLCVCREEREIYMVEWDNIATQSKYHKLKSRNHESFSQAIHPSPTTNVLYNELSLWWFNIYLTYFHTTRKKEK